MHAHAGVSLGKKWSSGYFYFGFSYMSTLKALFAPRDRGDYQMYLNKETEEGYDSEQNSKSVEHDYGIHPKLTVQFFF